ncbi:Linear gramicidin synthase subunit D [Streptomyces sp. YIM 130001]|uniref:non-ribosomal peptide synthetase n=1 Tax=Streptomyces sp. YIM 130001 TaxID=2259644 RepID=UPI000E65E3F2|nr:non-ribosomal peptide synthetase [Streptomyces sp. YIM 130001]RII13416.1 Linear gramicidin synthase subunit D [Streptomyces sp. YIM 130001]
MTMLQRSGAQIAATAGPEAAEAGTVPLTEEQLGLLLQHRADPQNSPYNVPLAIDLRGPLDDTGLEAALARVVARHPLLSARVRDDDTGSGDGRPYLEVDPVRAPRLERRTAAPQTGPEQAAALLAEARTELDLERDGVLRAVLFAHGPEHHTLLLVVHHLVVDGESTGLLLADLLGAYEYGEVPGAAPAPFGDYVAARTQESAQDTAAEEYWRGRLDGADLNIDFPLDTHSPDTHSPDSRGAGTPREATVPLDLDAELWGEITTFSRERRAGGAAVLLAAYLLALGTYSRQQAPTVGVPLGARTDPRFDRTVGYFVRTLLVRAPDQDPGRTAAAFVTGVQTELARAVDHSRLPFPRIAKLIAGGATTDPFNCTFVLHSWAAPDAAADEGIDLRGGLRAHWRQDVCTPGLGLLTLELYEGGGTLRGRLKYDAARIEAATAEAFTEHIAQLARQLVRRPDGPVTELDGIGPRARTTLDFLNATDRPFEDTDIDTLIRGVARTRPDAVAVEFGDRRWTRRELDARIEGYAAGLAARGVRAGDRVGVMLPRSDEAVAVMLGILRAGAAYVPLDAAHPEARRRHIVDSSGMRLAIVAPDIAAACPADLDQVQPADLPRSGAAPTPGPTPADALHVLYTSGSTGTPKGVQLSHRALVTDALAAVRHFGIGPDDAMLLKAPFTFDVGAHEMLVPLVAGARLVVAPPDAERDPDLLAETLEQHGVTLLHAVPSQLRLLLEAEGFTANRTLRTVVSTGESLPNELRVAFEAAHPARLHNAYGPTETSYSTVFSWGRGDSSFWTRRGDVPIGVPFDNIRCHVLDASLREVPPGAPGELWIGGGTVSDGYVGDPERTAERYRTLELGGRSETVYGTGDLVRLLPGGVLAHLGRIDDQVKINGNRVELGEVRAALMSLPAVTDASVQVSRHARGSLQIVAHVVTRDEPARLRAALGPLLPAHMVPAIFHLVPRIPVLPNGKTDRRALDQLVAGGGQVTETVAAPPKQAEAADQGRAAEVTEAADQKAAVPSTSVPGPAVRSSLPAVRSVWTELLGETGDDAQFFEAGGDSILAMQMVSRLRRAGFTLAMREIYRHPVLADLAAHLDAGTTPPADAVSAPTPGAPAAAARGGDVSPLAPVQSWFFRHIKTDLHQWNQSVLLELNAPVDPTVLRLALQAVVAAHPALSARFTADAHGDFAEGRMAADAPFAAYDPRDVLRERDIADDTELDEALEEVERSLDPLKGVHVRALLAHDSRQPESHGLLLLVVHHLVVDGVSWRILLEDLEHALASLAGGALPSLPQEACRYEEWVASLPAVAEREGEAGYWRALAAARGGIQSLLLTLPAPDERDIRRVEFSLDPEATTRLIGPLPRRLGLQVHQVMTGAFAHALARWRGTRQVTFDVETHGRHGRDDLFRTVGWFTSIHPVVLAADRALDPEHWLAQVADDLTAVPDGGVGFGACREFSSDPGLRTALRDLPAALACFNYYGQADQLTANGGFTMSGRPIPREHSARCERVYGIEVYGIVHGGRLRMGLTWVPSPADGVDESAVEALVDQMSWVLATLAGTDPDAVSAAEITAPGAPAAPARPNGRPGARELPVPGGADVPADRQERVPVTPQQNGLLLDALAHSGSGRYVEQLFWRWHGPLDTDRFKAAWQSVFDRETVLRAAFEWEEAPCLVLHDEVTAEVVRHPAGSVDWDELKEQDRLRGFDLREPGLLRATLLDDEGVVGADHGGEADGAPSTRVLVTFHHVLLDGWSVSVLLQEFYRAYFTDGVLAGDERRPDIRDYSRWLAEQDTAPARDFWSAAVPATTPLVRPAQDGPPTGQSGWGRAEVRLSRAEADRLRVWAAGHATTESSALQAVWAMLLYRAGGGEDTAPVGFGVTVSGRGIALDSVERLPGLLMNSLPMTIEVDPAHTVPELLTELRDHALDMAAYEWVSTGQIHEWSGRRADEKLVESLIVFENYPRSSEELDTTLAEHGIRVGLPEAAGSQTAFPVTLLAFRDVDGSLVLTAVHDRGRIAAADTAMLVDQCARLLRELPDTADGPTTVGDILTRLPAADQPRMAVRAEPATDSAGAEVTWPDGPQTQVVQEAWRAVFAADVTDPGVHFFEAGGHSLLAMRLLREINVRSGRTVRLDELLSHPRAGELAHLLTQEPADADSTGSGDVLVPLRPATDPGAGTIYLVHPPGGQVACYAQLAHSYEGPEALVGIRDPRVNDPEPEHRTAEQLAEHYLQALRRLLDAGERIVLGGFSGGGVIAYEMARQIAAEGYRPPLVVMVDAGAPDGELTDADADGSFANQLRAVAEGRTPAPDAEGPGAGPADTAAGAEPASGITDPDSSAGYLTELAQIADWLRNDGGGDPVALMRDSVEAVQRYLPGPYAGPVAVLRAGDAGFGRGTDYDESDRFHARAGLGWEDHVEDLAIRVVPGNHVTMLTGTNVRGLARILASAVRH